MNRLKSFIINLKPTTVIILGFFIMVIIGTFLLNLPISSKDNQSVGIINAAFTATSATCVTGLAIADTYAQWSAFGQIIIILLIQIGGLGFMSILTMFFLLARRRITLKERILIQESLNQNTLDGMVKFVKSIVIGTLIVESIGAIILSIRFCFDYGLSKGIKYGIFHSISAFCNAGFDILGSVSLSDYSGDLIVNLVVMSLIIIGGIGFTVWFDIIKLYKSKKINKVTHLSLHSKIVIFITPILLIGGAFLFFIFEYSNPLTMQNFSFGHKILAALMQSVTARTAGFYSISQGNMTYASKFFMIVLMFIGGSPAGTAGGIKTVTICVILVAVSSVIRGRKNIFAFKREIPFATLQKSLAVFFISITAVVATTMLLTLTERQMLFEHEFIDFLFEAVSALGTVGVTTGITPHLSNIGKIIVLIAMFMGRLGPITIVIGLTRKQMKNKDILEYPEENVIVG